MYIGNQPVSGAFQKLDNISAGFNGTQTTFPLTSNSVAVVAGTSQNLIISISGVVQEPGVSYYVAGSTIVFNEAPLVTDSFFGILMGTVGEVPVSALASGTTGQIQYNNAGNLGAVSSGTSGQVLTSSGTGVAPAWSGLKTVGGQSIVGTGNIDVAASVPEIKQPVNGSPASGATGVMDNATLTGSAYYSLYGVAMAASQWQVSTVDTFASTVVSTGDVAGTSTSYTLTGGVLTVNTQYFWRVRYKDSNGVYSDWSTGTSFTTAATFNNYIATPTATPAAFGDALDGGFYTGMIWGQVTQSSDSKALATGSQTFAVTTNMASTPLFYSGQTLEIRSRANPVNHFKCTVIGASGTTLTVNVTSISGSGTFSDWSVMSRYRMIVAPKASGHSANLLAYKNTSDAAPTACQTLTEGRLATLAMVAAGNSTVYPAAHFCNGLNIGGYTDWFLPARDQLELGWRNLKPTADNNYTTADRPNPGAPWTSASLGSYGDTAITHGTNNNSAPAGVAYTAGTPAQVANTSFRTGGAEAFNYGSSYYWSSSEYSSTLAWRQYWATGNPGFQLNSGKTSSLSVRAFRQSII